VRGSEGASGLLILCCPERGTFLRMPPFASRALLWPSFRFPVILVRGRDRHAATPAATTRPRSRGLRFVTWPGSNALSRTRSMIPRGQPDLNWAYWVYLRSSMVAHLTLPSRCDNRKCGLPAALSWRKSDRCGRGGAC
jgi:hypothetical protein